LTSPESRASGEALSGFLGFDTREFLFEIGARQFACLAFGFRALAKDSCALKTARYVGLG
jgi:hypothetical protein